MWEDLQNAYGFFLNWIKPMSLLFLLIKEKKRKVHFLNVQL